MKNTLALLTVALLSCLAVVESHAAVGTVATANISSGGGIHAIISQDLRITLGYTGPTNTIFGQFTFHTSDVGSTFSIDQSSDPGFLPFLARATNGTLNTLSEISYAGGSLTGKDVPETSFFTSFPYGGNNGIDLGGFQIQRIDLTLNSLNFASPGSNPNGDGIWTDYSWNATVSFIGILPVPEPGSAAILSTGLLVLLWRKHVKKSI
jgi:PEP-CTERM motif